MWLAYIDESGNTGSRLDDPNQPIHYLVALLVPEDQVQPLIQSMDDLAREALGPTRRADSEFHGAHLIGGNGCWKGVAPSDRWSVYRRALELIGAHDALVVHSSIDKRKLAHRYATVPGASRAAPHLFALQFLIERIQAHVVRERDPLRQRVLLVADETQEHESFALDLLDEMQRIGSPVGQAAPADRMVDSVHFVRSETNRGVQLADLIAYVLNRVERQEGQKGRPAEAARALWSELILPRRCAWRSRWP